MGVVVSQSIKNAVSTYIGFAVGAWNTLFLYTHFLTDEYYGLVGFLLSAATVMMPLTAFGVHNTLVKFYSSYKDKKEQNNFLSLMLYFPLLVIIPVGLLGYFGYEAMVSFLASENPEIKNYIGVIYLVAIAMAYFEVFYAWVKVEMQSVFGNFMKEVYHRVVISILLFGVYFEFLSQEQFIWSLVFVYFSRTLFMKLYAFRVRFPKLTFYIPDNFNRIFKYSLLIIVAGSIALVLLDIDKVMIGKYLPIEQVAYYNVAIFMATVIVVPLRSMHQIVYPLTAKLLNENKKEELRVLYQKSSLTLFVVSGLIFLLILLNLNQIYELIPSPYRAGVIVVSLISISKLFDNLLGINNAILYNSDYYRLTIVLGVFLAILTVVLNMIFIPIYGINGAAVATVISLLLYSVAKIVVVKWKFKMQPFTTETGKVFLLIVFVGLLFYFWDFTFHPITNVILKSGLVSLLYLFVVYRWQLSPDINRILKKVLRK